MNTSYLIAVIGTSKAVLMQHYAKTEKSAEDAGAAMLLDFFGEEAIESRCIDTDAKPGIWIEGDPEYVKSAIDARN